MTELFEIRRAGEGLEGLVEQGYNEVIDRLLSDGVRQWARGVYPTVATARDGIAEGCLYACYLGGEFAGSFILNESEPSQYSDVKFAFGGKALYLHTLAVRPAFWRKGVGGRVVRYALERAEAGGYGCVRLDVFPDNSAAVGLYRRHGFQYAGKVFFSIKEPSHEWYDCYERKIP